MPCCCSLLCSRSSLPAGESARMRFPQKRHNKQTQQVKTKLTKNACFFVQGYLSSLLIIFHRQVEKKKHAQRLPAQRAGSTHRADKAERAFNAREVMNSVEAARQLCCLLLLAAAAVRRSSIPRNPRHACTSQELDSVARKGPTMSFLPCDLLAKRRRRFDSVIYMTMWRFQILALWVNELASAAADPGAKDLSATDG